MILRRTLFSLLLTAFSTLSRGAEDSLSVAPASRHQLPNKFLNGLYEFVKDFSRVDTNYIEPQHYNFTVMLQNTNTYEVYRLHRSEEHTSELQSRQYLVCRLLLEKK